MTEEVYPTWGKTPRLVNLQMTITEKIDGTNGLIAISNGDTIRAGSRTRWLTPESDNFGFAKWVEDNKEALLTLGPGRHYGEWYGQGIQRGYGLDHKRFALFNTQWPETIPPCVERVPVLAHGEYDKVQLALAMNLLEQEGSRAVRGFMRPEGIIIWINHLKYKLTFEKGPKGQKDA